MPEISEVAEAVGESEDLILKRGISSYMKREIREARVRIDEIKEKYEAKDLDDLEEKIENEEVEEHPTWEELIEWRNLEERIRRLSKFSGSTGS